MVSDRGQAHTLEAFVASLVVLGAILFALQINVVTPLSSSTSNEHVENQEKAIAEGVMSVAHDQNAIKPTVLYWDSDAEEYHNQPEIGEYTNGGPPTAFGRLLNQSFEDDGTAFNVNVYYRDDDGGTRSATIVQNGQPSENAVSVRRSVVVYDTDVYFDADENRTDERVDESDFYMDDAYGGAVFNVVSVEVVLWRI